MATTLSVEVNDEALRDELQRLSREFADLTELMAGIGTEFESRVSARFETESDPSGARWAAWSPWTIENYPEDGNRRILDRYGDMLDSLSYQSDANEARVGFGFAYAAYHEFGTRKMPRRGMLFEDPELGTLSAEDSDAILAVIEDWLELE